MKKAFNGDVIAGGRTGLWVMNKTGTEWEKIGDGFYSDIFVSGTDLFALRCETTFSTNLPAAAETSGY